MSDLREIYQQLILDHNKSPRNFGTLDSPDHSADGHNPLCGDKVHVDLLVENGLIRDIRFCGSGCAISKASASLMTDAVKGKTLGETNRFFKDFQTMLTGGSLHTEHLGKLVVFAGVHEYPARVKCATLPWHTLRAALKNARMPITTEGQDA